MKKLFSVFLCFNVSADLIGWNRAYNNIDDHVHHRISTFRTKAPVEPGLQIVDFLLQETHLSARRADLLKKSLINRQEKNHQHIKRSLRSNEPSDSRKSKLKQNVRLQLYKSHQKKTVWILHLLNFSNSLEFRKNQIKYLNFEIYFINSQQ